MAKQVAALQKRQRQQQFDLDRQHNWLLNLALIVKTLTAHSDKRLGAGAAKCEDLLYEVRQLRGLV